MRDVPLEDALSFARLIRLDTGKAWEPEPFQIEVIEDLCNGVDRVWLDIPEGNAKSTLVAGICLIHMFFVDSAEVPIAAASRDQAGIILRQAIGMVSRSPDIARRFRCLEGYRRIVCPETGSRLQVYASDSETGDGVLPSLFGIDELHRHGDLELARTWEGKLGKRRGQGIIASTAGAPGSPYEIAKADALRECQERGTVERIGGLTIGRMPGFVLRTYAVGKGDDIDDLDVVKEANPLAAITVDTLRAKRQSPMFHHAHWARLTCGRPARDDDTAISETEWRALDRVEIPEGVPVAVGVDFAWRHDTTAIVPLWLPGDGRRVLGRPTVIVPPRDGTSLNPRLVRDAFVAIMERNPITTVALDPQACGEQFAEWIEMHPGVDFDGNPGYELEAGLGLGVTAVAVPTSNDVQGKVYTAFMEAIRIGLLCHPHDELLTSHVLNAVAKPIYHDRYRFERIHQSRAASLQDRRVIDALVAASIVHWQQTAGATAPPPPVNVDDYRMVPL